MSLAHNQKNKPIKPPVIPTLKIKETPVVRREHKKIAEDILSLHKLSHNGFEVTPKALNILINIEIPTLREVKKKLSDPYIRDSHLDITISKDQLTLAILLAIGQPIAIPFGPKEGMLAIFAHPSNEGIKALNYMKGRPLEMVASITADAQRPGTIDRLFDTDSLIDKDRNRLHELLDELFSLGPIGIYGNANQKSTIPELMYTEINGEKKSTINYPTIN